jgi:membrane protease YdiL (CAAX protease family)
MGDTRERPFAELAGAAGVLLTYIIILGGLEQAQFNPASRFSPCRYLVPSLWLAGAALVLLRTFPFRKISFSASVGRPMRFAVAMLLLAGAAGFALARRPYSGIDAASTLETVFLIALVPVAEELYFRGLLLDQLSHYLGRATGVVLTSVLFAFLHLPQGQFLPMFLLSIVLCVAALGRGGLAAAVALHATWNAWAAIETGGPIDRVHAVIAVALVLVALAGTARREHGAPAQASLSDLAPEP